MRTCEGCAVASFGRGFTVLRCKETEECALEQLQADDPEAQLMESKTCLNEHLGELVQNALDKPPLIL